jgi:integrase
MARMNIPGSVYRRSNGKFQAVGPEVYDPETGTRRRPGLGAYDTKREAKAALVRFHEERMNSGSYLTAADLRSQRLADWLDEWLVLIDGQRKAGKLGVRTVSGYRSAVDLHIRPALGHVLVGDLHHLAVHRWLVSLGEDKGLSDRTVQRMYRTLHRALSDAPLPENPVALPKHLRPTVRDAKEVYRPTPEEINTFLAHTSDCPKSKYLEALWRVAAVTGARRGELVAIEWEDLDLESGRLHITKSIDDDAQLFVKATKNEGTRVVGLDEFTTEMMVDEQERQRRDHENVSAGYEDTPLGLDLAFRSDETGALWHPNRVSQAFSREWRHAGLNPAASLHSLRHSLGSLLLGSGHPVTEVAAQLGHTPEVLQRVYARDLDEGKRIGRVSATVNAVFS